MKKTKKKGKLVKAEAASAKSEKFGNMLRITYADGCKVYCTSKTGIYITVPKKSKLWKDNAKSKKKEFEMHFSFEETEVLVKALDWWLK